MEGEDIGMTTMRARLVLHQFKWYLEVRLADLADSVSAKVTASNSSNVRSLTPTVPDKDMPTAAACSSSAEGEPPASNFDSA